MHMKVKNTSLPDCRRGAEPPCARACPFGLDVRDFIKKIRRGNLKAAFRLFRSTVGFPEIVSQLCGRGCTTACAMHIGEIPINLPMLEKICIKEAGDTARERYNLQEKESIVAIVGGGISGLACAIRLASKKYKVTVYEKENSIGGALAHYMPKEEYIRDIERQSKDVKYELVLNRHIHDLRELSADAVYIATGLGGSTFDTPMDRLHDNDRGIIVGGSITGCGKAVAIAQGLKAAQRIERYLKTGRFNADDEQWPDTAPDAVKAAETSEVGEEYSRDGAVNEADRCRLCDCDLCFEKCAFMRHYNKYPERIASEAQETITPGTYVVKSLVATRMIASCSDCGLCKEICPESIDIGKKLMYARSVLEEQKNFPPVYHAFAMRDFVFACGDKAAIALAPNSSDTCEYIYFPGCQMGAMDPEHIKASYDMLLRHEKNTGLMLQCCGIPAYWAGKTEAFKKCLDGIKGFWERTGRPSFILACPTCMRVFREHLDGVNILSLYEILDMDHSLINMELKREKSIDTSIFDPCASRYFPKMQRSVRNILSCLGENYSELDNNGAIATCCSWGGHIDVANPDLADTVLKCSAAQSFGEYITYCSVCKYKFLSSGKPARHILDVILNRSSTNTGALTLSQKNYNRVNLRNELIDKYWSGALSKGRYGSSANLYISDKVSKKISHSYLLDTDIAEVVRFAEATENKLWVREGNTYIAHKRIGHITCWVEYNREGDGFRIINVYTHRMTIDEDKREKGADEYERDYLL